MIKQSYKYSELTSKIIGSAMTMHKAIGNGFQEVLYQRALEIEMEEAVISFIQEMEMPVLYKNRQIGTRRVDFLIEDFIAKCLNCDFND